MTKKDYQAIARAIYKRNEMAEHFQNKEARLTHYAELTGSIADALAADNPRFHRETFLHACETGDVGKRPPRKREVA